ncbi:MAG: RsmB/NOP family class I SAM-dependent RNA methyltransferase [Peptococcaceae bacterium]|jgi:16S rRNA C967 or C1407 C5-methylase (RsmB/RsmF family)/NOL1/NOP2/fmu family ribosome biogenesis protein|nr:RsmB/NOP family class I SAM-dependent RNA methyltransferase [Peptococcaceae bacterium]
MTKWGKPRRADQASPAEARRNDVKPKNDPRQKNGAKPKSDPRIPNGRLPAELIGRLRGQLGEAELAAFLAGMGEAPHRGLRLNTAKGSPADMAALAQALPFDLEPVPWADAGYYYPSSARPAKLPFYQAGLYYLQEPSAMAAAAMLGAAPGDRVLDLCAAPGGKATQLAAALAGQGLLVANEPDAKRVKALIWNLEHWGAVNYLVMNEAPERLATVFAGFFDKALVDAPCSGEGMLRRDPRAAKSWQAFNGPRCREIQDGILAQAARLLRPGGRLLYSTCTFNPLENEEAVAAFLERTPAFHSLPLPLYDGWRPGELLPDCRQLWPHLVRGEGHFLALLAKADGPAAEVGGHAGEAAADGSADEGAGWVTAPAAPTAGLPAVVVGESTPPPPAGRRDSGAAAAAGAETAVLAPFWQFMAENLTEPLPGPFRCFDRHVYQVARGLPSLAGLKIGRPGWYLGILKNGRFVPSQAMAMGLAARQAKRRLDLEPDDELTGRYLRGETLLVGGEPGWTLVTLAGSPLGFGKQTGDYLKNHYPPGWLM